MSITAYSQSVSGQTTVVTVTSSLSGTVYYYWFVDGNYVGYTTHPSKTFVLPAGGQSVVSCVDSSTVIADPELSAPAGYPATRTLYFVRSTDPTIVKYCIQQQANGGSWTTLGYVQDDPGRWSYRFTTPPLTDLTTYAWQVIPINAAGAQGTAVLLGSEKIVCTPPAPKFTVSCSNNTVTFTGAT